MPYKKLPDYYHSFEITCVGVGRSVEAATASLERDKDYIKRWIKGSPERSGEVSEVYPDSQNQYTLTQTLYYSRNY